MRNLAVETAEPVQFLLRIFEMMLSDTYARKTHWCWCISVLENWFKVFMAVAFNTTHVV